MVHVLWECPVYDSIVELERLIVGGGGGESLIHSILLIRQPLFYFYFFLYPNSMHRKCTLG